jgi:hypothetical protein
MDALIQAMPEAVRNLSEEEKEKVWNAHCEAMKPTKKQLEWERLNKLAQATHDLEHLRIHTEWMKNLYDELLMQLESIEKSLEFHRHK